MVRHNISGITKTSTTRSFFSLHMGGVCMARLIDILLVKVFIVMRGRLRLWATLRNFLYRNRVWPQNLLLSTPKSGVHTKEIKVWHMMDPLRKRPAAQFVDGVSFPHFMVSLARQSLCLLMNHSLSAQFRRLEQEVDADKVSLM